MNNWYQLGPVNLNVISSVNYQERDSNMRIKAVLHMPCVKYACSKLNLGIKLKKSSSGFDLVTVLISKQRFVSTSRLACFAR